MIRQVREIREPRTEVDAHIRQTTAIEEHAYHARLANADEAESLRRWAREHYGVTPAPSTHWVARALRRIASWL